MTSSFEFNTYPARLSDAERDKALQVLRDGVAMGRLSHDTFIRRMDLALAARRSDELAVLTADLPQESRFSRLVFGTVEAVSGFTVRLRRAWQAERLPKLLLPHPRAATRCASDAIRPTDCASRMKPCPACMPNSAAREARGCCATSARPTAPR